MKLMYRANTVSDVRTAAVVHSRLTAFQLFCDFVHCTIDLRVCQEEKGKIIAKAVILSKAEENPAQFHREIVTCSCKAKKNVI